MTRHEPLPTAEAVRQALQGLSQEEPGRRVSVSALSRHLGLPNTTLRRHYPDLIVELAAAPMPSNTRSISRAEALHQENVRLRNDNRDLRTHLDIAIAHIQRLTIESDQLRRQAEAVSQIRRIPTTR